MTRGGGGVKKYPKHADVIYEWSLRKQEKSFEIMVGHIIAKPRPQIKVYIIYN